MFDWLTQSPAIFPHLNGLKHPCLVHFDLEMCFSPQWRAISLIGTWKGFSWNFDLQMCFAPQRCAILDILASKSAPNMRPNVLRPTVSCHVSTSALSKVVAALAAHFSILWKHEPLKKTQRFPTFPTFRAVLSDCPVSRLFDSSSLLFFNFFPNIVGSLTSIWFSYYSTILRLLDSILLDSATIAGPYFSLILLWPDSTTTWL